MKRHRAGAEILMKIFRAVSVSFLLFSVFVCSYEARASFQRKLSSSADGHDDAGRLLDFKAAVASADALPDWLPGNRVCDFYGVACTAGRVSSLALSSRRLTVELPHVVALLMGLDGLESLQLSSANVTGSLSAFAGMACAEGLAVLDLAGNSISGDLSGISSLRSCTSLIHLNLSGNAVSFSGGGAGVLPPALEELDLSFNSISGEGTLAWILSSGGCRTLRLLNLKGNTVSGQISFAECTNFRVLDLSANNFSGGIPDLGVCASLEYLDLSANRLSGEVGDGVARCRRLKHLNLSTNVFYGGIPAAGLGGSLRSLSLSDNHLQGHISSSIFESCSLLVEIDLSMNNLSGVLPPSFARCLALERINLARNNLSGDLPVGSLSLLANLKSLVLSYNSFSGKLPSDLLANLSMLETLDLSSNSISGPIPGTICQSPQNSLQELYLQNNQLMGGVPATLSNCSNLVSLDVSFNFLTGTIPSSLSQLSRLQDLVMWLNQLSGNIPEELSHISTLEKLILDDNGLTGGIPSSLSNCTNLNWLSLSSNLLSGEIPAWIGWLPNLAILQLKNNSFYGVIPPELGDCRSLIWLDLNSNRLTGPIPGSLAKQSGSIAVGLISGNHYAYLKNDGGPTCHGAGSLLEFAGIRPEQLLRVPSQHACNFTRPYISDTHYTFNRNGSMIFLDLSYNFLSGSIPPELGSMYYLNVLNLGHNSFTGEIPDELGKLTKMNVLDLSHNHLQGPIPPSFSGLSLLSEIDVSNNSLSGAIPTGGQLFSFPAYRFENNSGLCGLPLPDCGDDSSSTSSPATKSKARKKNALLAGRVVIGILFSFFCIMGIVVVFMEIRKRKRKKKKAVDNVLGDSRSLDRGWKYTGDMREALSISLATFENEKPLRKLTLADLIEATNNFNYDSLIGSGGFGDVYKAQLKDGSVVAVKKLIHVSAQGDREFTAEMETIGRIKHRNLVPLLGYCKVGEERLLVYEYMKNGSLGDVLHNPKKGGVELDWPARRRIAAGAARGLAFLHHSCSPHIIHRDMKSSNVLLDDNLEARVADFGMARLVSATETHLSVSTLAGTPGYVPPEYYQSFRCSTKGDVYSFGVLLLELLTGRKPTDSSDFGDNNLVGWVKQHAKLKIGDVFDPALGAKGKPEMEVELLQHLRIACQCLDDRPWRRPIMLQVVAMFKELHAAVPCREADKSPK